MARAPISETRRAFFIAVKIDPSPIASLNLSDEAQQKGKRNNGQRQAADKHVNHFRFSPIAGFELCQRCRGFKQAHHLTPFLRKAPDALQSPQALPFGTVVDSVLWLILYSAIDPRFLFLHACGAADARACCRARDNLPSPATI
jgi:hypothetical protein